MADDRIDPEAYWCDAARDLLLAMPDVIAREKRREFLAAIDAIAAALREAHEAGLRESGRLYDEHSRALDRLLEQAGELATIRRELAARRAVDGWLRDSAYLRAVAINADGDVAAGVEGDDHYWHTVAKAPSYPALAEALGLEVEDE